MNGFIDAVMQQDSVDRDKFIQAMNDPTTRDTTLAKFRAELASIPQDKLADKIPPLSRNMRRQLKKLTPQLKAATEKVRTLPEAEREQLATDLREKEPDAPSLDELTAVMPFMLELLALAKRIPEQDKKTPPKPKAADAFAHLQGLGRFSNTPWMNDYYAAQMQAGKDCDKKGQWLPNSLGEKVLRKEYPRGGTSMALIRGLDEAEGMNNQLRQEVLERLGPFTLDVSLAFTAALCDPRNKVYPLQGAVLVTTKKILEYKKFQQRGERREEMERKVEQAVKDLQRLRIDFNQVKIDKREAITIPQARLFDIQEVIKEQQEIDGTWVVIEKGWWVRAGIWEQFFLTPNQRLWFSYGAIEALQLSHSDNRPADQIAKLLWVELFISPGGTWHTEGPKDKKIGELLGKIGVLLQPDYRGKDWYWKLRANFEAAATQLIAKGAIVEWHYLPGCPLSLDQSPNAAELWLESTVVFVDPAAVAEQRRNRLPATAQKRAELEDQARALREARNTKARKPRTGKGEPAPTEPVTAAVWKQWRNESGLQQAEAARRLGVDQSYISLIERGKRLISPELATKLRAMMDSQNE